MGTYASSPTAAAPSTGNLTDDVVRHVADRPAAVGFSRLLTGRWTDVSWSRFHDEVTALARGMFASGVSLGDRVALLSSTRYEWTLADYAIWWVGGVSVPLYDTSPAEQIRQALSDSAAIACLVENAEQQAAVWALRSDLPALQHVWCIEEGVLRKLAAMAADVSMHALEGRRRAVVPSSPATIVYTPGTTGPPKRCLLSHGNLMFERDAVTQALGALFEPDGAAAVLYLPLAHVYGRLIQLSCIRAGARLGHCSDLSSLGAGVTEFRPTFVLVDPHTVEAVYRIASAQARAIGRGRLFDSAAETAVRYSIACQGSRPGPLLRIRHAVFERLVYGKLRAAVGGRLRHTVSSAATLGERLAHFSRGIGIPVIEGYGLTETCGAVTVNLPDDQRIGTAGRPVLGVELEVADDGELLVRGQQLFNGYGGAQAGQPDLRYPLVQDDGWWRTGDLGEIDADGYLRVTGRKQELLVTAGGKTVAPSVLEDRLRTHPLISQCLVVGDGKPFVGALITLDAMALRDWATELGKYSRAARLVDDPALRASIQAAVDDANSAVSQAGSIRAFRLLDEEWTQRSGHLTPTLTLRRTAVLRDFQDEVESLYG